MIILLLVRLMRITCTVHYKATLLYGLFLMPDEVKAPDVTEPKKPKGMTVKKRMETWAPKREAWTL
ncbi:hypothetical protein FACS189485_17090 [Spirochaetia bacterium]|nr:hypothetical protein FACS189485_17090 [Spirochaetia bacterium]